MRLYHQCWIEFLDNWAAKSVQAEVLPFADSVSRSTQIFVGGLLGHQREGDKYTGEKCVCHRCSAPRNSYLRTDHFQSKSMIINRNKFEKAAKEIVVWDADGRNVRAGPGTSMEGM